MRLFVSGPSPRVGVVVRAPLLRITEEDQRRNRQTLKRFVISWSVVISGGLLLYGLSHAFS